MRNIHNGERSPRAALALVAACSGALLVSLVCSGEQKTLSPDEIKDRCEDAEIKVYPVDSIGDEDRQLHAPVDERAYGTAVLKPGDKMSQKRAQKIMLGSGGVATIAFNEANTQLHKQDKVDEDHPARVQLSALDSFIVTKDANDDKDPKTKPSVEKIAEDVGIDKDSIECIGGFNADYKPEDGESYKVFIPRQVTGKQVAGYNKVVLRKQDNIQSFAKKVQASKSVSINGMRPIDFRAGTILYTKGTVTKPAEAATATYESPTSDIKAFADHYKVDASAVEKKYGVPKEVALAQAILESSYGKSELATKANNFHGLKANEQWTGPVYKKLTQEVVAPQKMSDFPDAKVLEYRSDGLVVIEVESEFKKFSSPAEGFLGYGDHLKNRGDAQGKYYADAFKTKDPLEFVEKLVDSTGKSYATDPEYVKKISRVLAGIKSALTPGYTETVKAPKPFESYTSAQQALAKGAYTYESLGAPEGDAKLLSDLPDTDKARVEFSIRSLNQVKLSKDGYNNFLLQISQNDLTKDLPERYPNNFGDYPIPKRPNEPSNFILHVTGNPPSANGYDGAKFALSMANSGGLGMNDYINNKGVPYRLTDHYTDQMFGYNGQVFGVELAASAQAAVKPVQYEAAIYLAANFLTERGYLKKGDNVREVVSTVVRGHGDMRAANDDHTDFPPPVVDVFHQKLSSFLENELGY